MRIKSLCFKHNEVWITFCMHCGKTRSFNQTPLMNFWNQLGFYDPKTAGNFALEALLAHIKASHHDGRIAPNGPNDYYREATYLHYRQVMQINQEHNILVGSYKHE